MGSTIQDYHLATFKLHDSLKRATKSINPSLIALILAKWEKEDAYTLGDENIILAYFSASKDNGGKLLFAKVFDMEAATDVNNNYKNRDVAIRYDKEQELITLMLKMKRDTLWANIHLISKRSIDDVVISRPF